MDLMDVGLCHDVRLALACLFMSRTLLDTPSAGAGDPRRIDRRKMTPHDRQFHQMTTP